MFALTPNVGVRLRKDGIHYIVFFLLIEPLIVENKIQQKKLDYFVHRMTNTFLVGIFLRKHMFCPGA